MRKIKFPRDAKMPKMALSHSNFYSIKPFFKVGRFVKYSVRYGRRSGKVRSSPWIQLAGTDFGGVEAFSSPSIERVNKRAYGAVMKYCILPRALDSLYEYYTTGCSQTLNSTVARDSRYLLVG